MNKEALRRHGFWNLALIHYRRDDVAARIDRNGDAIVRDCLVPLVADMRASRILDDYSWMRYSEGGFHIRCQFRCQSQEQGQKQLDAIRTAFEAYKAEHAAFFSGAGELSAIAAALNKKSGIRDMKSPGTLECGPAYDSGEESVYDTLDAFVASMHVQTRMADFSARVLGDDLGYARNLLVAQICGYRLLCALAPTRPALAAQAGFVAETWRRFFGVDVRLDGPGGEHLWTRREAFWKLFGSIDQGGDAGEPLPPSVRETCRDLFAFLGSLDLSAFAGERPMLAAMQALSLYHQLFNRLGISIVDETIYCDLIRDHACTGMPDDQDVLARKNAADWLEYWSVNRVGL